MSEHDLNWEQQYKNKKINKRFPTEFVMRTLLGSYPDLKLDKDLFPGSKILDLSCGDGRNLEFLSTVGFKVYASEINQRICDSLSDEFPYVDFSVGYNHNLPYKNNEFDYILACHSCYYLEPGTSFADNLREIKRVLKPGGVFIGSLPSIGNFILDDAEKLTDGSAIIKSDPFGLRNGYRLQYSTSKSNVLDQIHPFFSGCKVSELQDDYYGLKVFCHTFVCY